MSCKGAQNSTCHHNRQMSYLYADGKRKPSEHRSGVLVGAPYDVLVGFGAAPPITGPTLMNVVERGPSGHSANYKRRK